MFESHPDYAKLFGSQEPIVDSSGDGRLSFMSIRAGSARIAEVRIDPCTLPKDDPEWKFALAANPNSEGWIVTLVAEDGICGYGYASSMPHYGAPLEAVRANVQAFADVLKGTDSRNIVAILHALDRLVVGNNQAKAAIDCALHDLQSRRFGVPLCELVWAIVLTKEIMWEFLKDTILERQEEVAGELEALELIGQFFDRAIYSASKGYENALAAEHAREIAKAS